MNTTYAVALLGSASLSAAVAWFAWLRRPAAGAGALAFLGAALAIWSVTYAVSWTMPGTSQQHMWIMLTYLGVVAVPPGVLILVLDYTHRLGLLARSARVLLIVEPLVTLAILGTDSLHGWFFGGFEVTTRIYNGGPWFWINTLYAFVVILVAVGILISTYATQSKIYRKQTAVIIVAVLIPVVVALAGVLGITPLSDIDITPFTFTASSLLFVYGLFRFGFLEIVPVARDQLIESMSDGVIVVDMTGRIIDVNPAVRGMLGLDLAVIGEASAVVFAQWANQIEALRAGAHHVLIELEGEPKCCIEASLVKVRSQKDTSQIAWLITLRDVTARIEIETAEHEQRALAEALRDTAEAIGSTLELDEVLDRILESVGRVVSYDACAFFLYDAKDDSLNVRRAKGYEEQGSADILDLRLALSNRPLLNRMYETGEPLAVGDVALEPDWVQESGISWARSMAATPLFVQDDLLGFLIVESVSPNMYSAKDAKNLH